MLRALLYLLTVVILITVVMSVLGILGRAFTSSDTVPQPRAPGHTAPQSLKKDPVCGTFVAASTEFQKSKGGETYYFCSSECRDKF